MNVTELKTLIEKVQGFDKSEFQDKMADLFYDSEIFTLIDNSALSVLTERAKELHCKTEFSNMIKNARKFHSAHRTDIPDFIDFIGNRESINPLKMAQMIEGQEHYYFYYPKGGEDFTVFWYSDGIYQRISKITMRGKIRSFISETCYNTGYIEQFEQLATVKVIEEIYKQLIYSEDPKHILSSLEELNTNEDIIVFEGGNVLKLDTMTTDCYSPKYLCTVRIPCRWVSCEQPTPAFDKFIAHLANYDSDAEKSLIQMIGVLLSNQNIKRYKKALFLIGDGDAGKSLYLQLISRLIGYENCCTLPFDKLEDTFSVATLYGMRFAADPDAQKCAARDSRTFKNITGGDLLYGNPKGKTQFSFTFRGGYIVCSNIPPQFGGDVGAHVFKRILPIQTGSSIPEEKQNKNLIDEMYAEREGIVFKAISALKEAIDNNYELTMGAASKAFLTEYQERIINSIQFLEECCKPTETTKGVCSTTRLYQAYRKWCELNNERAYSSREFKKHIALKAGLPERSVTRKSNFRYYIYTLTSEAKEELGFFDITE